MVHRELGQVFVANGLLSFNSISIGCSDSRLGSDRPSCSTHLSLLWHGVIFNLILDLITKVICNFITNLIFLCIVVSRPNLTQLCFHLLMLKPLLTLRGHLKRTCLLCSPYLLLLLYLLTSPLGCSRHWFLGHHFILIGSPLPGCRASTSGRTHSCIWRLTLLLCSLTSFESRCRDWLHLNR